MVVLSGRLGHFLGEKIMNSFSTIALETLESRTLYSTTPSATILADMQAIQADKDQINVDQSANDQTARADDLQLATDQFTRLSQVSTLVVKQLQDSETDKLALLTDTIHSQSTRLADRTIITEDLMMVKADRADAAAEMAAATALAAAKAQLGMDIASATTTYKNDQLTFKAKEKQDKLDIQTARLADDPAVDADKEKILTDKLQGQITVLTDQKQLLTDELKLVKDKIAKL
jgi:hypothetical protein